LYKGSAGIALFLALLHRLTGNDEFQRTALGAIDRSIRQLERSPPKELLAPLSFFSGNLGVAYVARQVGALIGHSELFAPVESILDQVVETMSAPHDLDLIGGNAGAIPALLEMGRAPGLGRCRDLAVALGEELCRVDPSRSGISGVRKDRNSNSELDEFTPSGLSHGAAGIGRALLELHAATGRLDFQEAARRSFEYEDTLFDPQQGNWADLRRPSGYSRFERAWCNGAPGCALARLRAAELDPDQKESYLAKARVGIATTLKTIDEQLKFPRADATLCHGLVGLIEIVWIAGLMLEEPSYRDRALTAARALIDRYSTSGDWPSGLYSGGPNSSLMVGTAGVGYTFLRLLDPDGVPSILLLTP
jgi:lantibiotic modifying enzyme